MESALNKKDIPRVGLNAQQFTLDEYWYELRNPGYLKMPSPTDFTDPLYRKKYA